MVNTLQLLRYMSLFTLYYPKNLILALSYVGIVNFDNVLFSKLFMLHFNPNLIRCHDSTDYRYNVQNIPSQAIIISWADLFTYLILIGWGLFTVFLITRVISPKRDISHFPFWRRIFWKFINYLHKENSEFISNVIRIGIEIYIDLFFSSIYNLYKLEYTNYVEIYSSTVAFFWTALMGLFGIYLVLTALLMK